jgi:adenosylcobinamide-GDP ribazoletransferase
MGDLQTAIRRPLRSFLTATGFLTLFPVFFLKQDEQLPFGAALYYFTIVGLFIGMLAAAAAGCLNLIAPSLITAVLLALLLSSVSGFLHMDGLADTADGFLSSRNRERCLEIMKDSRIGVMGAAAVSSILLLKTAAIYSIIDNNLTGALIVSAAAGRTSMVLVMHFLPYARAEGGLGKLFDNGARSIWVPLLSVAILLITLVMLQPGRLLIGTGMFLFIVITFSIWCLRKIGGYTGDTLGCLCELTETGLLLSACFFVQPGIQ